MLCTFSIAKGVRTLWNFYGCCAFLDVRVMVVSLFHTISAIAMTSVCRPPLIKSHSRLASVQQDGSEGHI